MVEQNCFPHGWEVKERRERAQGLAIPFEDMPQ
jgi:hypothetical protein